MMSIEIFYVYMYLSYVIPYIPTFYFNDLRNFNVAVKAMWLFLKGGSLTSRLCLQTTCSCTNSLQDHFDLQTDVDTLVQWLLDHNLTLNVKKCKSLLIMNQKEDLFTFRPSIYFGAKLPTG